MLKILVSKVLKIVNILNSFIFDTYVFNSKVYSPLYLEGMVLPFNDPDHSGHVPIIIDLNLR